VKDENGYLRHGGYDKHAGSCFTTDNLYVQALMSAVRGVFSLIFVL